MSPDREKFSRFRQRYPSLAHSLGRKVVAEGVEHRDILDLLIEMGCDIAQGFAIGRPMSLESLTKRIASDRKRSAA